MQVDNSFEYGIKDVMWSQTYSQFLYDLDNYRIYDETQADLIITFYLDAKRTQERMIKFEGRSFKVHNNIGDDLKLCINGNRVYYEVRELSIFKLGTKIKVKAHEVSRGESYDIELLFSSGVDLMDYFFDNYKLINVEE